MVVRRSIEAKSFAEFFFRRRKLPLLKERGAKSAMRSVGIRIERDRETQLLNAVVELVIQQ